MADKRMRMIVGPDGTTLKAIDAERAAQLDAEAATVRRDLDAEVAAAWREMAAAAAAIVDPEARAFAEGLLRFLRIREGIDDGQQ